MKHIRFISLLLVLLLVCMPILAACGDDEVSTYESSVAESSEDGTPDLSSEYTDKDGNYIYKTSGKDWSSLGTITFLTAGVNTDYVSEIVYNVFEDESSTSFPKRINDGLKERSAKLEEAIGVTVEEKYIYDGRRYGGEMANYIRTGNLTGTDEYQVVAPCMYDGGTLAVEGQLIDLNSLEDLQIKAPWWNQNFNETVTMANQLYFTVGDIGMINKNATAALYFNYDFWNRLHLSDNYGGRDPYQLVRDGDWTVDITFETARLVDPSSAGAVSDPIEGVFGWGGQKDDMWSIFFGSGAKIAQAGADGLPELTMYNERNATLLDKLQDFVNDKDHYISGNNYFGYNGVQWPMVLIRGAFIEGRALYYNTSISEVNEMGTMEEHFGMVPIPKADTTQDNYYSLINPWISDCFAIPISNSGEYLAMTVDALNILGAVSANTIAKDYDEIVLAYMRSPDAETTEMIFDYILPNRACDIGMIYKWGGLDTMLQDLADLPVGSFTSRYDALSGAAQTALDETVSEFKKNAGIQ